MHVSPTMSPHVPNVLPLPCPPPPPRTAPTTGASPPGWLTTSTTRCTPPPVSVTVPGPPLHQTPAVPTLSRPLVSPLGTPNWRGAGIGVPDTPPPPPPCPPAYGDEQVKLALAVFLVGAGGGHWGAGGSGSSVGCGGGLGANHSSGPPPPPVSFVSPLSFANSATSPSTWPCGTCAPPVRGHGGDTHTHACAGRGMGAHGGCTRMCGRRERTWAMHTCVAAPTGWRGGGGHREGT